MDSRSRSLSASHLIRKILVSIGDAFFVLYRTSNPSLAESIFTPLFKLN